jgi:hypothetical protein
MRKHRFSTPFWICSHFVELNNLWLIFLGASLDYQQICVEKWLLRSPLGDVSDEILQDFFK